MVKFQNGDYLEILNCFPLDGLEITMKKVIAYYYRVLILYAPKVCNVASFLRYSFMVLRAFKVGSTILCAFGSRKSKRTSCRTLPSM